MAAWIEMNEAAALVPDGSKVALGGAHCMSPLALVGAIIHRGVKGLHLITAPTGGLGVELLVVAGAVARLETAQISLGEFGLAPAFRRGVEEGRVHVLDAS